jgi:hypothetical protein
MRKAFRVVLAKRSMKIDLEYGIFRIEEGKTYLDNETTVFDAYIDEGLKDGSFEETLARHDTIVVDHPDTRP